MLKTFSAEIFGGQIFGGANGSVGRGKRGGVVRRAAGGRRWVLFAVPRAAGGVDTSQGESRGWGGENTHVRLSLCLRGSTQNVAYTLRS
jgi:hypothetical protein